MSDDAINPIIKEKGKPETDQSRFNLTAKKSIPYLRNWCMCTMS